MTSTMKNKYRPAIGKTVIILAALVMHSLAVDSSAGGAGALGDGLMGSIRNEVCVSYNVSDTSFVFYH